MSLTPATNRQIPDNSILDYYNKQVYLGNQFNLALNGPAVTTTETPLILLVNPAGSPTGAISLFSGLKRLSCISASSSAVLRFYLNATVSTTGTLSALTNLRPANPAISIAKAYTIGQFTVSANGVFLSALAANAYASDVSTVMNILDPGQNMLVTVQGSASAGIAVELSHYEL